MKYIEEQYTHEVLLESSGRRLYAFSHILGIDPHAECVSYGADGGIGYREEFSLAERAELADHMIALWTRFKETE